MTVSETDCYGVEVALDRCSECVLCMRFTALLQRGSGSWYRNKIGNTEQREPCHVIPMASPIVDEARDSATQIIFALVGSGKVQ